MFMAEAVAGEKGVGINDAGALVTIWEGFGQDSPESLLVSVTDDVVDCC